MNYFSTLDPYPEYFTSEIQLVEQIPSHWNIRKLKYTIRGCTNGIWGEPPNGDENDVVCIRVADFNRHNRSINLNDLTYRNIPKRHQKDKLLKVGDLLLEKSGGGENQPVGCVVLINQEIDAVTSNFIARMPIRDGFESRFLNYLHWHLYDSKINTKSIKQTTGIQNIDQDAYLSEKVGIPPLPEQRAIANFLDNQTAKIDALIAKQERLIELLEEKRNALVAQAVTKGLDPNVPMKDSGVEWLGEIPEHWLLRKLKLISTINDETLREATDPDYEIVYIDIGNIDKDKGILGSETFRYVDAPSRARRIVRDGDIIVSTVRTYLRAITSINNSPDNLIVSTGFAVIRPRHQFDSTFARYVLRSPYFVEKVVVNSTGVSYPAITTDLIGNIEIALPSISDQILIATYLNEQIEIIGNLISKSQCLIKYVSEYRSSLISAAVTGKIDVRDWQEKEAG